MAISRFWEIKYYDSGSGGWIKDINIPRAGLENIKRTKTSTLEFVTLADGSEAKSSSEIKSNWGDLDFVFPQQVVTDSFKLQLLTYVDNEQPVRITVPVSTGASLYTEKILEGYLRNYIEEWPIGSSSQEYAVRVTMHEFDVD